MDEREGRDLGDDAPAEERGGGDEVAGGERSGRGVSAEPQRLVPRGSPQRTARTVRPEARRASNFTGEQRLLIFDAWQRSDLTATDFAPLVGVTRETLYAWRRRFEAHGPAGLVGLRQAAQGSRLREAVKRAILLLKQAHPDWGQDRIHDVLIRGEGLSASPGAIQRVLVEAGYTVEQAATKPHPPQVRRFERARPNSLWQTDLFTFILKRQNRRVHLAAFMDDFSRFIVGFGLHASASGALVREVFETAIANFGAPEEVLTDNGTQYHTWRGKSAFRKLCDRRGIRQIVASPRRPQTLGKIERMWGTLWRELVEGAVFRDLEEARARISNFFAWYNFQRTHQGIDGLVPADRFFEAAPEVREALEKCVAQNAKELALHGEPRKGVYLTGRVGERPISLHSEGTKMVLTDAEGGREEVDLSLPGRRHVSDVPPAPGTSALDGVLEDLAVLEEGVAEQGVVQDDDAENDDAATDDAEDGDEDDTPEASAEEVS